MFDRDKPDDPIAARHQQYIQAVSAGDVEGVVSLSIRKLS
jgi:hypothetical protein